MYSNSKSYEKKYRKYKSKYQKLKSHIGGTLLPKVPSVNGGAKGTLLNGGDCDPLPNPEEDDIVTTNNLLDLCPTERITIQNKCYEVKGLYRWIVIDNHNRLPLTRTFITPEEKQELIQVYNASIQTSNILTRDKLNQIYPNLQVSNIYLRNKGYSRIAPGTFSNNLLNLRVLYLNNNRISELLPNTFNNLPALHELYLNNNQINVLPPNTFGFLPKLRFLYLNNNQISVLNQDVFNNMDGLLQLYLNNNQISTLPQGVFNNLSKLRELFLNNNQINILQKGVFNNLSKLQELFLNNNQIHSIGSTFGELHLGLQNNLPNLFKLHLNNNLIRKLPRDAFDNLPLLKNLYLYNNPIVTLHRLLSEQYYGLSKYVNVYKH